ncbi:MAG: HAD-IB family hydrolase [Myxococcota bacterium]
MKVAFFDFDKTLIERNSGSLWLRHQIRAGAVGYGDAARAGAWLLWYHLGLSGLENAMRLAITTLAGQQEDALRAKVKAFYASEVRPHYRPLGLETLRRHQDDGDAVVLLTSASVYLGEAVQQEFGLDDIICNRFQVDDEGVFTGEPEGLLCFGEGKRVLGEAWLRARGAGPAAFYTDSMSDVSFMEVVEEPVAVTPDPRLRRLAKRRGWRIEDWRKR